MADEADEGLDHGTRRIYRRAGIRGHDCGVIGGRVKKATSIAVNCGPIAVESGSSGRACLTTSTLPGCASLLGVSRPGGLSDERSAFSTRWTRWTAGVIVMMHDHDARS